MSDNQIKLDLDPKKVLQSLTDMSDEMKDLARTIEESLGKEAPKAIEKTEKAAEKGSSNIAGYFRNLGQRVKEDLKTAFDVGGIVAGLKIGKEIGDGVKSVFDLERAFDRLNTRLQLTGKSFENFKKDLGEKVAATGQKLEDVFPGVEAAAERGGIKSPEELSKVGEQLAKVRAATGEGTEGLANSVVEILKTQGKKINAQSFKETLDALQATRVQGAFKTAGEAGQAIESISPYAKQLGLNTREMGGLAATASKSGQSGQDILRQLAEKATQPGGMQALNSIFGVNLFKNGKLDASQIGKINVGKFGAYSPQIMEQATGLHGASGADLKRFVDSFKGGMGEFHKVVNGTNETAAQFKVATNNLASGFDQFREKTKNAGREIGESLSEAANQLLKGDFKGALGKVKEAGKSAFEHKGVLAGAIGMTGAASILLGGGIGSLAKKIPGAGKLLGGVVGGEAAKAAGIQPVYVTNASEIGAGAGSALSKFGGGKVGGFMGVLGAGAAGYELGSALQNTKIVQQAGEKVTDMIFRALNPSDADLMKQGAAQVKKSSTTKGRDEHAGTGGLNPEALATATAKGVEIGMQKANRGKPVQYSNPSRPSGSGDKM